MKIYFDVCCLNRPFDERTHDRIHLEAEAVILILKHIEQSEWHWINSGVINYEVSQTPNIVRRNRLESMLKRADLFVAINDSIIHRGLAIQQFGIKTYDALHIAAAEQAEADVFLSTDDKLLKIIKRHQTEFSITANNPLHWLQDGLIS